MHQTVDVCDRASLRSRLGRVGVRSGSVVRLSAAELRSAAAEIEQLGYGALWYAETQEVFAQGAILLAGTARIMVCSSIASIYARDAVAAAGGANALSEAFGGRFVLGLGASHRPIAERRGHVYRSPLPAMRAYLDLMDASPLAGARAEPAPARVLAALGPQMLELSAARAAGAHPYCVPVEHTAFARGILGPEPLLCVEQAVALASHRDQALAAARRYLDVHLAFDHYRNNLIRLGWRESDITTESVFDRLVAWGDAAAIRGQVEAHLEAGADHVCIQPLPTEEVGLETLRVLAPALRAL